METANVEMQQSADFRLTLPARTLELVKLEVVSADAYEIVLKIPQGHNLALPTAINRKAKNMKNKKHKLAMLLALLSLFIFPITVKAEVNNNAIMYYNTLPENVRVFVGTKNVSFNSVDTISYYSAMGDVMGLTTFRMAGDLVTGMTVEIKKGREDCLIHEVGHVIDTAGGDFILYQARLYLNKFT